MRIETCISMEICLVGVYKFVGAYYSVPDANTNFVVAINPSK